MSGAEDYEYENPEDNQRFFYQLDGEGIRYEIVAFAKSVEARHGMNYIDQEISKTIASIVEDYNNKIDLIEIK